MVSSTAAQPFGLILLLASFSTAATADVLISYESDVDNNPTTPDVIDIDVGQTATITISLSALDGETGLCAAGFSFAGTPTGAPSGVVVVNGPITLSDFLWDEPFQDPGQWLTNNNLPSPAFVSFFCIGGNIPLTLATVNVTGHMAGEIMQDTGPVNFADENVNPLTVTPESASFTVNVIPEPTTAFLLIVATATLARRAALRPHA